MLHNSSIKGIQTITELNISTSYCQFDLQFELHFVVLYHLLSHEININFQVNRIYCACSFIPFVDYLYSSKPST